MHENLIDPCVSSVSSVYFLNGHQIQWHEFSVAGRVAREGQSGKPGYGSFLANQNLSNVTWQSGVSAGIFST